MKRTAGLVVMWLGVTIVAILIASAAVAQVRGHVTDSPAAAAGATSTTSIDTTTSTVVDTSLTTTTSASTISAPTTTTTTGSSSSSTVMTEPTVPATTATAPASTVATYELEGGWVRISSSPGIVTLDGAGPYAGFTVDANDDGPDKVDVEFEGEDHDSRFVARWEDGKLDIEIDESDED